MLITYQAKLISRTQLTADVYLYRFTHPGNPDWNFKAGQYMIMHIPQESGTAARRLYSIASAPYERDYLDFIIQHVPGGIGSEYLSTLQVGDELTVQGPAGIFTMKETTLPIVFLATGTGIAPMRSMLREMSHSETKSENLVVTATQDLDVPEQKPNTVPFSHLPNAASPTMTTDLPIHLFWGLKVCEDMYLFDEFKKMTEENKKIRFNLCLSRECDLEKKLSPEDCKVVTIGRVTTGLDNMLKETGRNITDFYYYLCGGKEVIEGLRAHLAEKGIPKEQVHFEKFT